MKHYSASIARTLMRYLRKKAQMPTFDARDGRIEFLQPGSGQIAYYHCSIQVKKGSYTVTLRCPITPAPGDAAAMAAIAKYLSSINQTLDFGSNGGHLEGYFDLNCNSGSIAFTFFTDCYMRLSPAVIRDSLEWPVLDMERAVPGILAILFRGVCPEDAIGDYRQRVESDTAVRLPKSIA